MPGLTTERYRAKTYSAIHDTTMSNMAILDIRGVRSVSIRPITYAVYHVCGNLKNEFKRLCYTKTRCLRYPVHA